MTLRRNRWSLLAALVLGATITVRAAEPIALSGRAMGTTWAVKYLPGSPDIVPEDIRARVAGRLEQLEQQCSTFRAGSELSRFNASRGLDWFPVSRELAAIARGSREISELTGGVFDPTVFPLVQLWGFGPASRRVGAPTGGEIAAVRQNVDWRALDARDDPPALRRRRAGVMADFSSMAKGFAADAVSACLVGLGVNNHLVQIGGDVATSGLGPAEAGWRLGIENPVSDGNALACAVMLKGEALSTSGNYRNFLAGKNGGAYGHIIDPRTGAPVEGDVIAVSVIATSSARSSALATALFVLGAENGMELATREGIACLFIVKSADGRSDQRAAPTFENYRR